MAYVAVKGGEQAIDNAHAWLAEERRGDPAVPDVSLAQIAEQLRPRGGSRDGRRLAVRPGTRGAGGEAGAGRSDRGGVPAARLSHHAAAVRAIRSRWTPPRCGCSGASRRCSRTCRAARCWARPTTTRTGCWISRWPADGVPPAAAPRAEPDAAAMPRVPDILGHEGLIEPDGDRRREPGDLTREPLRFPADARRAAAGAGARRRRVPAGAGLFDAARLRRHASVRRRNPHGRGVGGDRAAGTRLRHRYRRHHR